MKAILSARGVARAWLCGSAALHLYFGVAFALAPGPWMEALSIRATAPAGLVEMRAFYGGLLSALGLLFAIAALYAPALRAGLVTMTVTYLGAAVVRALAMLDVGVFESHLLQLLALEASGAISGALLSWRLVSADPRPAEAAALS